MEEKEEEEKGDEEKEEEEKGDEEKEEEEELNFARYWIWNANFRAEIAEA